jgi:hypothetical protein
MTRFLSTHDDKLISSDRIAELEQVSDRETVAKLVDGGEAVLLQSARQIDSFFQRVVPAAPGLILLSVRVDVHNAFECVVRSPILAWRIDDAYGCVAAITFDGHDWHGGGLLLPDGRVFDHSGYFDESKGLVEPGEFADEAAWLEFAKERLRHYAESEARQRTTSPGPATGNRNG